MTLKTGSFIAKMQSQLKKTMKFIVKINTLKDNIKVDVFSITQKFYEWIFTKLYLPVVKHGRLMETMAIDSVSYEIK